MRYPAIAMYNPDMPAKTKAKKKTKSAKPKKAALVQANQYEIDPRQALFLAAYMDPKSETFSNALQSALKAGYSQEYAESITSKMPAWLSESVGSSAMVMQAEAHLKEVLAMPIVVQAMGAFGPLYEKKETMRKKTYKNGKTRMVKHIEKVPVMTINTTRVKEKTKVAEITLEAHAPATYGKQRGPKLSFTFNAHGARARYEVPAA